MPFAAASSWILFAGPTRIGCINPLSPASIAPASAVSSHGCATAVGTGSRPLHLTSSCSYFPVPDVRRMVSSFGEPDGRLDRAPRFLQEERQNDRQADA